MHKQKFNEYSGAIDFLKKSAPVPFDRDDFDLLHITSDGKTIYNQDTGHFLTPYENSHGRLQVKVFDSQGNCYCPLVHVMVADAYILNPNNKEEVHHIDLDRLNNALSNLVRVTKSEHLRLHDLHRKGDMDSYNALVQSLLDEQIYIKTV